MTTEKLKPTETITWIGKHEPISMSISFNLLDKPIFKKEKDTQSLNTEFVVNLDFWRKKNKTEMLSKFLETENNIKKWLHTIRNEQNSFNKGEAREYEDEFIEDEEESERFCFVQFWRH